MNCQLCLQRDESAIVVVVVVTLGNEEKWKSAWAYLINRHIPTPTCLFLGLSRLLLRVLLLLFVLFLLLFMALHCFVFPFSLFISFSLSLFVLYYRLCNLAHFPILARRHAMPRPFPLRPAHFPLQFVYPSNIEGYTNCVQMYVTDRRRLGGPHKVYLLKLKLKISSRVDWTKSTCLSFYLSICLYTDLSYDKS